MKVIVSLVAAATATAAIAPVAARSLATTQDRAARSDLELLSRNAQLFAIQNGHNDVSLQDFKEASSYASYRAEDWPVKPRYDPVTQRFFANPRGGACLALELQELTSPDGSVTQTASVIVERPATECAKAFADSSGTTPQVQPADP